MRTSTTALAVSLALILSFLTSSSARAEVAAVGAGTYENDSPAVTLSGDWALKTSTQDSAGSFAQLGGTGYAQISFTTSGIKWIARKSSSSGQADVYLDGVKVQTVDLYASATQYQQTVYEVSGLPETTHTLRIVRTGTKNTNSIGSSITLDAFIAPDIYPPSTPTGLTATPDSTGIRLTWTANTEPDLAGYRLYRANGSSWDNVADKITDTTYLNADLQPGTAYSYRLVALDNAGNESPRTATVTSTTAVAAVGAGTYENDSPAVTLSGDWALKTSTQDSAGSFAQLGGTGYAQISFTTSGIKWIARKSSSSGQADVYLDGVKVQTVDLYASATQYQQTVYEVSGLPETTHTLRIVRTGTKNTNSIGSSITLDAFIAPDIYPPSTPTGLTATPDSTGIRLTWTANTEPDLAGYRLYRANGSSWDNVADKITDTTYLNADLQPGTAYSYRLVALDNAGNESPRTATVTSTTAVAAVGAGTYENDSPAVTLSGDWALKTSTQDSAGSFAQLGGTGYAQISFTTSGIKWIARKSSSSGQADVYLDGVKVQTVDLYASATQYQQTVYEVSGLPETTHTLRIVRTGTKNTNSIGSSITLDAFIAPDIYPPSTPTGLTATPDSTGIRLTWTANTEPDLAGYRLYRANGSSWDNVADKITDTTYLNADLQPGTAYSYRLVALDNAGNESPRTATVTSTTAVAAVGAGTYENDSPAVTLSGDWALKTSTQDSAGSFAQLGGTGYAQISFTTSGIKWIARKSSSSGQADVYLDGVKVQTVDLYASATQYQQTVYEVSGLPETTHTLRIVRTGTKNTNSIGSSITLDAFIAPDIYPPSTPTGLTATPDSTGIRLTWTANTEPDLAGYRLYRSPQGAGTWVVVQNAMVTGNTLLDFGLPPSTSYDYRLAAIDTSDNYSARATTSGTSAALPSIPQPKLADCPAATTSPQTESQLRGALANANPGDVIRLAANTTYNFAWFTMTRSGTAAAPIWICGPKSAVIDGQGTSDGRGLRLDGVSYVNVIGFTMRNGSKGIQVKNSSHVIVSNLTLKHIGDEAIHLLANTTDSYVVGNIVDGTGVEPGRAFYGEGVYIGTARENRCQYSDCQPDRSDRNVIAFNQISNTTSETVEVKAGASDGWIFGNTLDGASMTSDRPSPIVIMGNRWVIAENVISHPNEDAIQVWTADYEQQFGLENQIFRNTLGTSVTGYTARIGTLSAGTMVGCDNDAGQLGVTNIACQK